MMGYQSPFFNPYGFMQQSQQIPQAQPVTQVTKVNGENGAKAFPMGANSSALLLDESGLMVWLCTTDGAGYKSVSAYDITPHQNAPAPDYGSLESRIQTVEKKLEEMISNGNSKRTATVGKKQSEDAAD
jgi:hypothetical protein